MKIKFNRKNDIMPVLVASMVAMNMFCLPPYIPEEKFRFKKSVTEEYDLKRKDLLNKRNYLKRQKVINYQNGVANLPKSSNDFKSKPISRSLKRK